MGSRRGDVGGFGALVRVIWASHSAFAGCVASARNAAAVLGGEAFTLHAGGELVPDCDMLVLSSWHDDYEPLLSAGHARVVARWHSTLLQTELSGDLWKLERLLDLVSTGRAAALVCDDRETAAAVGARWLPNVLDEREYTSVKARALRGVAVVLPGEPHARKSLLVQTAAFELARAGSADWTLHLTGHTVRRPELRGWLERGGVPFVDHGLLAREAYLSLVAGASAGLAASLTESWGYAACDFVALGVPVVVSPAVVSVTQRELVGDPESVESVAAALARAITGGSGLARMAAAGMRARAADHARIARAGLSALIEQLESGHPASQ